MVTMKGFSDSSSPAQDPPPEGSSEEPSSEQTPTELPVHTVKPTASATDWNAYVEDNLSVMRDQEEDEKVTWPRDSLFRGAVGRPRVLNPEEEEGGEADFPLPTEILEAACNNSIPGLTGVSNFTVFLYCNLFDGGGSAREPEAGQAGLDLRATCSDAAWYLSAAEDDFLWVQVCSEFFTSEFNNTVCANSSFWQQRAHSQAAAVKDYYTYNQSSIDELCVQLSGNVSEHSGTEASEDCLTHLGVGSLSVQNFRRCFLPNDSVLIGALCGNVTLLEEGSWAANFCSKSHQNSSHVKVIKETCDYRSWPPGSFGNATLLEQCQGTEGLREHICRNTTFYHLLVTSHPWLLGYCADPEANPEDDRCFLHRIFDMLPSTYDFDSSQLCQNPAPYLLDVLYQLSQCEGAVDERHGWIGSVNYVLRVVDFIVALSAGLEEGEREVRQVLGEAILLSSLLDNTSFWAAFRPNASLSMLQTVGVFLKTEQNLTLKEDLLSCFSPVLWDLIQREHNSSALRVLVQEYLQMPQDNFRTLLMSAENDAVKRFLSHMHQTWDQLQVSQQDEQAMETMTSAFIHKFPRVTPDLFVDLSQFIPFMSVSDIMSFPASLLVNDSVLTAIRDHSPEMKSSQKRAFVKRLLQSHLFGEVPSWPPYFLSSILPLLPHLPLSHFQQLTAEQLSPLVEVLGNSSLDSTRGHHLMRTVFSKKRNLTADDVKRYESALCMQPVLWDLIQREHNSSALRVLVQEYLQMPQDNFRTLLMSAENDAVKRFLSHMHQTWDQLQVSQQDEQAMETMTSAFIHKFPRVTPDLFVDLSQFIPFMSVSDIMSFPASLLVNDSVLTAIRDHSPEMKSSQKRAFVKRLLQSHLFGEVPSWSPYFLSSILPLLPHLPLSHFQQLTAEQLSPLVEVLGNSSLDSTRGHHLMRTVFNKKRNLTADDVKRLGALLCSVNPEDLRPLLSARPLPSLLRERLLQCVSEGLTSATGRLSHWLLLALRPLNASILTTPELASLHGILPQLGASFLQSLSTPRLLDVLADPGLADFPPAQASLQSPVVQSVHCLSLSLSVCLSLQLSVASLCRLRPLRSGLSPSVLRTLSPPSPWGSSCDCWRSLLSELSPAQRAAALDSLRPLMNGSQSWPPQMSCLIPFVPLKELALDGAAVLRNSTLYRHLPWSTQQAQFLLRKTLQSSNLTKETVMTLGNIAGGLGCDWLRLWANDSDFTELLRFLSDLPGGVRASLDTVLSMISWLISAGLSDMVLSSLVREQLEGLTPAAIALIAPSKLAVVLSTAQLSWMTPEQAGAVTPAQWAELSSDQSQAVAMAQYEGELMQDPRGKGTPFTHCWEVDQDKRR
ncbi:UNVERIFIED_CONTAM: hypothetical protein FKN15_007660 [Acipenser sinensis]